MCESEPDSLEQRVVSIVDYACLHIAHPCGLNPAEKAFMKQRHIDIVNKELLQPGVVGHLTPGQKAILQALGLELDKKRKDF
jgi:hypothetical protein